MSTDEIVTMELESATTTTTTTTTTTFDEPTHVIPPDLGHISGSDDEDYQPKSSKSSTPDSKRSITTTAAVVVVKKHQMKTKNSLVSYHDSENEEEEEENENDDDDIEPQSENQIGVSELSSVTPLKQQDASPSSMTTTLSQDVPQNQIILFPEDADIKIPQESTKSCSHKLEQKFAEYYNKLKKTGVGHVQNAKIQELKDFRNPSMYEKMISHLDIDEIGTNFPPELYDPHWWGKESYYEELGKAQKLEMDRREKERRDRTKIQYVTAIKKVDSIGPDNSRSLSQTAEPGEKRKTRFDM